MNLKRILLLTLPVALMTGCAAQQELQKENAALHTTISSKSNEINALKAQLEQAHASKYALENKKDRLLNALNIRNIGSNTQKTYLTTISFMKGKYKDIYLSDGIASWIKENRDVATKIIIIGKSDDEKDENTLVAKREAATADYLISLGYKPEKIQKNNGVVCNPECLDLSTSTESRKVDIIFFQ